MKKKQLFIFALLFAGLLNSTGVLANLNAKGGNAFEQGNIIISAGYGFPNIGKSFLKAFDDYTDYKIKGIGPAHLKFEYALSDKIGMGASVNYVSYSGTWSSTYYNYTTGVFDAYTEGWDVTSVSVLARMNLHFATSDKLDPYWGIGAGYKYTSFKWHSDYVNSIEGSLSNPVPVGFETTLGLRYYFTDNIGAYMEVGFAKSIIQGGLSVKF